MARPTLLTSPAKIWGLVAAAAVVQFLVWSLVHVFGAIGHEFGVWLQAGLVWVVILALASNATNRIGWLTRMLARRETAHLAALDLVGQLETQNSLLKTLADTNDLGLAFQSLARLIAKVVRCDRLGLALVKENGQDLQTFTARVAEAERRNRPRPELEFKLDRTLIGSVVKTQKPLLANDLSVLAPDFVDANVLHGASFRSALFMPLVARNRPLGTLNLVSRSPGAFNAEHAEALRPVAEILAVGILAQQLQMAVGKYHTMEAMAEFTLSVSNEINGAVQAIVGQCDLLERSTADPALQRDLALLIRQAQRISELLDRLRVTTQERLRETAAAIDARGAGRQTDTDETRSRPDGLDQAADEEGGPSS